LGNSPTSEFYMPTFRNAICSIFVGRGCEVCMKSYLLLAKGV